MSYHIVSIDAAQCSISCRDGQLTCKTSDGERQIPIEDVASIIITSFSASIHTQLFVEAARHGVALIICEAFKPVSLLLPANRCCDTLLTRAILNLSARTRAFLWQKTLDAKCRNQLSLAEYLSPEDPRLREFSRVAASRVSHRESTCARWFWQILGEKAGEKDFARVRERPGLNALLNYGYAVLLSTILQKLYGVGLDPTFGMSHATRERSTPLAYDLMEPFRPCVDWRVLQWVAKVAPVQPLEVSREFRKWVTAFPLERVEYLNLSLEIQGVIEGVVRGFRRAVLERNPRHYKPWTPKNSKWAGSS